MIIENFLKRKKNSTECSCLYPVGYGYVEEIEKNVYSTSLVK